MNWIKYIAVTTVAFIFGTILASFAAREALPRVMFKEVKSPFNHEKTIEVIRENVIEQPGWSITTEINQRAAILKGGGDDIGPYDIIKICSGEHATRMLNEDERAFFGVMMPISIAVYEKKDGHTYVSLINGDVLSKVFGQEYEEVIKDVRLDMESIFRFMHLSFDILS